MLMTYTCISVLILRITVPQWQHLDDMLTLNDRNMSSWSLLAGYFKCTTPSDFVVLRGLSTLTIGVSKIHQHPRGTDPGYGLCQNGRGSRGSLKVPWWGQVTEPR